MSEFKLDGRKCKFLDDPARYAENSGLIVEPLARQFKTAKDILERFQGGRGVLLADDVGLGKTTVGAVVAWIVACQGMRVRIYAPNKVLRRRWAEELDRHIPLLKKIGGIYESISNKNIRPGKVERLRDGSIQVATHDVLVKMHDNNEQRTACDLMIIDEAHRAKGDSSAFNIALRNLGGHAKRKLILTATPFSIRLTELEQLLQFVGATDLEHVRGYANELKRLYCLGDRHDVIAESSRLVNAAEKAIEQLQPYLIRHGIENLSKSECKHFGKVAESPWEIPTAPATQEDLALLLRMDRILQLMPEKKDKRRNDPRFHIGWQHLGVELEHVRESTRNNNDSVVRQHVEMATNSLSARCSNPHPKVAAVRDAIRAVIDGGEKVLVFCHHHATASELLTELEGSLKKAITSPNGPAEEVWRAAWESLLPDKDPLVRPIIDWLCTPGLRAQISEWLVEPAATVEALRIQLEQTRPRHQKETIPKIADSASTLTKSLLDHQSTSTRSLLRSIARRAQTFDGKKSHFPGRLDDGLRAMGAWDSDAHIDLPKTLYTGKPDIVLAIFNSPFGPDVLVTTDRLSEGVDMHRCCRHLIHYELDPSPIRTIQRNGRVRRVGSWAALTDQPIQYAYPTFDGTRDEKAVGVMQQRINVFGLLLGGVPSLDPDVIDSEQNFSEAVLRVAKKKLDALNRKLCVKTIATD